MIFIRYVLRKVPDQSQRPDGTLKLIKKQASVRRNVILFLMSSLLFEVQLGEEEKISAMLFIITKSNTREIWITSGIQTSTRLETVI